MGNQNTSGILEEEKSRNEGQENVSCIDDLKENETKNIEEGAKSDCHDVEAHKSDQVENVESGEKVVPNDILSKPDEPKELNLEKQISKSNDVHDQICTSQGEMQRSNDLNLILTSRSTIKNSNSIPHEGVKITSEPQEDHKMLVEETTKTVALVNSCLIEDEVDPVNTKIAQNAKTNVILDFDDCDLDENGIENDMRSEDSSNEALIMNELVNEDKTSNVNQTLPLDKEIDSFSGLEKVDLVNEAKVKDECDQIDEEQIKDTNEVHEMVNEVMLSQTDGSIVTTDNKTRDEIHSISGLEKLDFVDEANVNEDQSQIYHDQSQIDQEHLKGINEVYEMAKESKLSLTESSIATTQNTEDDKSRAEIYSFSGLEEVNLVNEAFQKDEKSQNGTVKESGLFEPEVESQSSSEIKAESEVVQNPETLYPNTEPSRLEDLKFNGNENSKKLGIELRKSPSFEFGIPFDVVCEESDQTPLLYQERTISRSFSSRSTLRFKDRSVQTEYLGVSLANEGVEVEEKTIRMERSCSESLKAPSLNVLNNEEKVDVVTNAKHEKGLNGSIEDCDTSSPKGSGKRKVKSSLFTTCICCTAAIS